MARWEFDGGKSGWQPYDDYQQGTLNLAWSKKETNVELTTGYRVNLKTMKQCNMRTEKERDIRRVESGGGGGGGADRPAPPKRAPPPKPTRGSSLEGAAAGGGEDGGGGGGGGGARSHSGPRRQQSVQQVEVIKSYEPITEGQIACRAGEFLTVKEASGREWLVCVNEAGEEGEIPRAHTQLAYESAVPVPLPLLGIHKQMSVVDRVANAAVGEELWGRKPALLAAAEATGIHCGGKISSEDRIAVLMAVKTKQFTIEEAAKIVELLGTSGSGGSRWSKAGAKGLPAEIKKNRAQFLNAISIAPYGVLGLNNKNKQVAPLPGKDVMFVDPASVKMIQEKRLGPSCAGGASGAIYRYLGINRDRAFPYEVKAAVQHESDAGYKKYGDTHVIHTVGPDFKLDLNLKRKEAVEKLAKTYKNIFTIAAQVGRHELRLLPVSGGIFSGKFRADMPGMTAEAIIKGYKMLSEWLRACIRIDITVKLCIFGGDQEAHAYGTQLKAAVAKYG